MKIKKCKKKNTIMKKLGGELWLCIREKDHKGKHLFKPLSIVKPKHINPVVQALQKKIKIAENIKIGD